MVMGTTPYVALDMRSLLAALTRVAVALEGPPPTPNWETAPKWAQWHAYDLDGSGCWYGKRPRLPQPETEDAGDVWHNTGRWQDAGGVGHELPGWQLTLSRRPEAHP